MRSPRRLCRVTNFQSRDAVELKVEPRTNTLFKKWLKIRTNRFLGSNFGRQHAARASVAALRLMLWSDVKFNFLCRQEADRSPRSVHVFLSMKSMEFPGTAQAV